MKTSRLIVLVVLSVTAFLLIPRPVVADTPSLHVEPSEVVKDQSILIWFEDRNATRGYIELTIYYGGVEVKNWHSFFNRTYQTRYTLESWYSKGQYSIRAWIDNETYWASFKYVWSIEEIIAANRESADRIERSNNDLAIKNGLIFIALLTVILVTFLFLALWIQHAGARDKGRTSWVDAMKLLYFKIRRQHPALHRKAQPKLYRVAKADREMHDALQGNPRLWDMDAFKSRAVNLIKAVKEEHTEAMNIYVHREGT